jgi:Rieske Fe-S protein
METVSSSSSCGAGCGCGGISRREVLAVGLAAAVVVGSGAAKGAVVNGVDEGTWVATVKAGDLVDGEGKGVDGQALMLSREGKKVFALSTKCTHKGCTLKPKAGVDSFTCQCHNAKFDLEGNVVHAPAKLPLPRYALRLNKDGVIEVDMSAAVDHDAVNGVLVLS